MLEAGVKAPDFEAINQDGEVVKLSDLKGKKVVLYFYPKDNTPGCTKEAINFRDYNKQIEEKGALVIGVSPNKQTSHRNFCDKYELNFDLLVDDEHTLAETYGSWGLKKNYGREYMGIIRSTFIIDEDGTIIKVFPKVKAATHGEEVLNWLSENLD